MIKSNIWIIWKISLQHGCEVRARVSRIGFFRGPGVGISKFREVRVGVAKSLEAAAGVVGVGVGEVDYFWKVRVVKSPEAGFGFAKLSEATSLHSPAWKMKFNKKSKEWFVISVWLVTKYEHRNWK